MALRQLSTTYMTFFYRFYLIHLYPRECLIFGASVTPSRNATPHTWAHISELSVKAALITAVEYALPYVTGRCPPREHDNSMRGNSDAL